MIDSVKAIKRVSFNEFCVGLSFILGPVFAIMIHKTFHDYKMSYSFYGIILTIGIIIQGAVAVRKTKNQAKTQ